VLYAAFHFRFGGLVKKLWRYIVRNDRPGFGTREEKKPAILVLWQNWFKKGGEVTRCKRGEVSLPVVTCISITLCGEKGLC